MKRRDTIPFLALALGLATSVLSVSAFAMDIVVRVPEPDTIALVGVAVAAGILVWRSRRK